MIYPFVLLYLLRVKVKEAFKKKIPVEKKKLVYIALGSFFLFPIFDKTHQNFFIKLTHCPSLFSRPQKSKVEIKKISLDNLKEHHALGFRFFLPSTFEKFEKASLFGNICFINRENRDEIFFLNTTFPSLYKTYIITAYARYNPMLLLERSSLCFRGFKSVEEVKIKDWQGVVWISFNNKNSRFQFNLKNSEEKYIEVIFMRSLPLKKSKKEAFQLISLIEKLN
ncbi:MAG: hypothetical protein B6D56_00510 [Candidatus Omnitrophica bacterium 4484_70.1]|nr:MAG: hypothetical protein B6D56_00510 [Candidatus Omnitrophica bacterium 4484_70.1]